MVQPDTDALEFPRLTLLNNVDRLTQPHKESIEIDEGGEVKRLWLDREPLLDQLESAIASSQTTVRRGASLASQRSVLDASAYMLNQAIRGALKLMWDQYIDAPMPKNTKNALRQWQMKFRKEVTTRDLTADAVWKHVRQTGSWIKSIELKFDPPITLEVTRPCPSCETQHVYDQHNERVTAVVVTWHKSFEKSQAVCRACSRYWVGESELRQLRYEIDQRDTLLGGF